MSSPAQGPEEAHAAIERFLATSKQPALVEPGEEQILLTPDNHALDLRAGRLTIQAWDDRRNLTRRITAIKDQRPGQLELVIERFGKQSGTLSLLDVARPRGQQASKRAGRLTYREQFRRSLSRQLPGWTIRDLSAEPDLEHSLSPTYPRAFLTRGSAGIAAIGAPPSADASGALTFGLIWLDYLRRRERRASVDSLVLFIPVGQERTTALRVLHLDAARAEYRVFAYDETYEARIDVADHGNVDTRIVPRPARANAEPALTAELAGIAGVAIVENGDASLSVRVRGLEIARERAGVLEAGIDTKQPARIGDIAALAAHVARVRTGMGADRAHPLFLRSPELWLESQVRAHIDRIDASLLPVPLYGQVPAVAASDRGIIDLLAADLLGRLAVLELKAGEDPNLPLQALDYWIRVDWHRRRGEFTSNGYFPGIALADEPPRMLLIAPALHFHPTTATVLSYFAPAIAVERVGVGMDWRNELKIAFRMKGA